MSSNDDERQLFQTSPPKTYVSMGDAASAMIAVRQMDCPFDRMTYCEARGIEYRRLQQYFFIVRALEYSLSVSLGQRPIIKKKKKT